MCVRPRSLAQILHGNLLGCPLGVILGRTTTPAEPNSQEGSHYLTKKMGWLCPEQHHYRPARNSGRRTNVFAMRAQKPGPNEVSGSPSKKALGATYCPEGALLPEGDHSQKHGLHSGKRCRHRLLQRASGGQLEQADIDAHRPYSKPSPEA